MYEHVVCLNDNVHRLLFCCLVNTEYSNIEDLVSLLLTERLMLFHSLTDSPSLSSPVVIDQPRHLGLTTSPTSSLQVYRYSGQSGIEGMIAYLIDCYERLVYEERYIKVF